LTTAPPERRATVSLLADRPQAVRTLERWFIDEWAPWYGPEGPGDAAADLKACLSPGELPIAWVAVSGTGETLGTVTLKTVSAGSDTGWGPWLTAFLVDKRHRGTGIGAMLVAAAEEGAADLGYDALYVSTDTAGALFERRGWIPAGTTETLRGEAKIYRKRLR